MVTPFIPVTAPWAEQILSPMVTVITESFYALRHVDSHSNHFCTEKVGHIDW